MKLTDSLRYEIPGLLDVQNGCLKRPETNLYTGEDDKFDPFALLDYIEFVSRHLQGVRKEDYHKYWGHCHLSFYADESVFYQQFQPKINDCFERTGLLYRLNEKKQIERIVEYSPLSSDVEQTLLAVKEPTIRNTIEQAIAFHKKPGFDNAKTAVEKLWDAFERIKSLYQKSQKDKKKSICTIIESLPQESQLNKFYNQEFECLTNIGNQYSIRHSEITQTQIEEIRIYDYFFNRCISLLAFVMPHLEIDDVSLVNSYYQTN